MSDGGNKNSEN